MTYKILNNLINLYNSLKMNDMKRYLIIIFVFMVLVSCEKWPWQPDKLHLEKSDYNGNELRIDGYYYLRYGRDLNYVSIFFLYQNGIILYGGSFLSDKLPDKEKEYLSVNWYEGIKDYTHRWGLYNIEGNRIKYERWVPMEGTDRAYTFEGEILNDTTFVITESYRIKRGKEKEWEIENEVYHFKQFSPKPDSTNNFVK